jgi:hypothetical protein
MKYFALGFSIAALVAVIMMGNAQAAQTLDLEDYYTDGSDKVCIYSNGRTTVAITHEGGGSCPSKYVKH